MGAIKQKLNSFQEKTQKNNQSQKQQISQIKSSYEEAQTVTQNLIQEGSIRELLTQELQQKSEKSPLISLPKEVHQLETSPVILLPHPFEKSKYLQQPKNKVMKQKIKLSKEKTYSKALILTQEKYQCPVTALPVNYSQKNSVVLLSSLTQPF